MALPTKMKNKRRWQEIGVAIIIAVLLALPTMVVVAYTPDMVREWQLIYQQYGPGRAYTVLGILAVLTLLYTAMFFPVIKHYRGGIDWMLGKPVDDVHDDGEAQ